MRGIKKLHSFQRLEPVRSWTLIAFVVAAVMVGTIVLVVTRAAMNAISVEAETGTLTGVASRVSDASASGGSAIAFGLSATPTFTATPTTAPTTTPTPTPSPTNPMPFGYGAANGPSGTWNLKLNDNFDGSTLDTSVWSTGWHGSGITPPNQSQETACYDPNQVVFDNGILRLKVDVKATNCNGTRPYVSGAINTENKREYTYGFFEARIWLDASNNAVYNWPAWWLNGHSWPTTGEVDVMEGLSGTARATWHGPVNGGEGFELGNGGVMGGWHVFAAEWQPGYMKAFYDGKLLGTYNSSSNITSAPQYLILMAQMSPPDRYGGPVKAPSEMDIDYVRVWQR